MKFIKVKQTVEYFDSSMKTGLVDAIINLDNVELLRDNPDGSLTVYLCGRDKPFKILDEDSIKRIFDGIKMKREKSKT